MPLFGFFVDNGSAPADFHRLAAVALVSRDELDAAVAVTVVVPVDERRHPQTGLLNVGKGPSRVIRPVFCCPQQQFQVWVAFRHPWSGAGPQDSQYLQAPLERRGTHDVAGVCVQHQGLLSALADPLADASPAPQVGCDGSVLAFGDIPGDNLAAPNVEQQVELEPYTPDSGGQIVDVPAPDLSRAQCSEAWQGPWFLWRPCSTAPVGQTVGGEHLVITAFCPL